jgi:hypothetical protein
VGLLIFRIQKVTTIKKFGKILKNFYLMQQKKNAEDSVIFVKILKGQLSVKVFTEKKTLFSAVSH